MTEYLTDILTMQLAQAAVIALFGGIIHGYTGFGGALFMVPLVALIFGPVEAVALMAIAVFAGSAYLYRAAMRDADWHELVPLGIAVVIATPIGALALLIIEPEIVKRLMGAVVLLFAGVMLVGWRYRGPRNTGAGLVAGGCSGLLGGFVGFSGPPLVLYFLSAPAPVETQRANLVISVAIIVPILLIALAIGGALSGSTLGRSVVVAALYASGAWLGERLFNWAPKVWFQRAAIAVLAGAGVSALIF